jgi:hypothetical protein
VHETGVIRVGYYHTLAVTPGARAPLRSSLFPVMGGTTQLYGFPEQFDSVAIHSGDAFYTPF